MTTPRRRREELIAVSVAYLALVAAITLSPDRQGWGPGTPVAAAIDWLARHGFPQANPVLESVSNVVIFVPFGILAWLWLLRRWWVALLLGVAVSCCIELSQWAFLPDRDASLHDVAMNSLGTAVGVAAAILTVQLHAQRVTAEPRD